MQTDFSVNMGQTGAGSRVDNNPIEVQSLAALVDLAFGKAIVRSDASSSAGRIPKRNIATVIFDADLIASNVINGTVNGTALTATTFASTHAATMGVIAGKIDALLLTLGITAVSTVSSRTITTVATDGNVLFASFVVTAGSSQAGVTHTYTTTNKFQGISLAVQKAPLADGTPGYLAGETVNVCNRGRFKCFVRSAVVADTPAYACLATAGDEGDFTDVSTGNIGPVGMFRSTADDDALAVIELIPQLTQ